ncbi:MAG: hypothetical protein NVSMB70_16470 [Chamaesiphon sp.]
MRLTRAAPKTGTQINALSIEIYERRLQFGEESREIVTLTY